MTKPLSPGERAHMGALAVIAKRGPSHMAKIGAAGQDSLSRRIAAEAGLDPQAPDYLTRLAAARRLYFTRLRHRRQDGGAA